MPRLRPAFLAAAAQVAILAGPSGPAAWAEEPAVPALVRLDLQGGSEDDHRYARAALGLQVGCPVTQAQLDQGLAAVRLTDRFLSVSGALEPAPGGLAARILLLPVPGIAGWRQEGSLPAPLNRPLFPGLHKGLPVGNLRMEQLRSGAELLLREWGYPKAQVRAAREADPARLRFEILPGAPDLIRALRCEGDPAPYDPGSLLRLLKATPGRSLWTGEFRREALARLRQRFLKDRRYQGQAKLSFGEDGTLVLKVDPGPKVRLASEGAGLGLKSLKDLVPLARSEQYSPELLEAGARSIVRYLRAKGYLDAEVTHRTEVLQGPAERPAEIRITYVLNRGRRLAASEVRFERNQEVGTAELQKAADLPGSWLGIWPEYWTADLIGTVEDRIKALYRARGYADISLRKLPLVDQGGKGSLTIQVREGSRRVIQALVLEVPEDPAFKPWFLAETLAFAFADQPRLAALVSDRTRRYASERPGMDGVLGTLEELTVGAAAVRTFRMTFNRPLPLVKSDLAAVLGALRQRTATLGVLRPASPELRLDTTPEGTIAHLRVPAQPISRLQRLVVQGADRTRARAVLREVPLQPGAPMDAEGLGRAQTQVGNLGAFDQVDLLPLREGGEGGPTAPSWGDGDLLLKVNERAPWIFSSGFGYDKSQGYHLDLGAQRLNVGGMGRTLDFGVRAGDATIRNPTLRKWFPTGEFTRSVDMYRVAYTDPWFAPGFLEHVLPDRTQLTMEGAYVEEQRSAYLLRRRRLLAGLEWELWPGLTTQAGYRFERTEVRSLPGAGIDTGELTVMARTPPRAIISAPWLQIVRDRRDNRLDPTSGSYSVARFEFANQLFGTSPNSSFVKLDVRQQWNWALGYKASHGVISLGLRAGAARPTASSAEDLPLSERFFAGGPGTHRGIEPDSLGPLGEVKRYDSAGNPIVLGVDAGGRPIYLMQSIPLGGQGLVLANLEYRFPTWWQTVWGEVFVDSGQVYQSFRDSGQRPMYPPLRTALGVGLILKIGLPIKFEYAADVKRILGRPRTQLERDTQLKSLLFSAGFQF